MKKLLSILLCAALVLGLAACGTAAEEPSAAPASGTSVSLTLTVDGESVTEDAVLANGNYYLPASFYTGLGVEL